MDRNKLIEIIGDEKKADAVLKYNNSITYRKYKLDESKQKWELEECR